MRMARAFNKKVHPREFKAGDLILRKVLHISADSRGKFTPKYKGSYIMKKVLEGGALTITNMDGQECSNRINANAIKKYYP